jgi:hypothetical protein
LLPSCCPLVVLCCPLVVVLLKHHLASLNIAIRVGTLLQRLCSGSKTTTGARK